VPAVLTILMAPDTGPGPAFQAHIDAHLRQCRLLAHVDRQHTRLARPGPGRAWRFEPVRPQYGMNIYAIGNPAGLSEMQNRVFADPSTRRAAEHHLTAAVQVQATLPLTGGPRPPTVTLHWPRVEGAGSQLTLTHTMPGSRVPKLLPDKEVRPPPAMARYP
jgi:hypothetical protein